MKQILKVITLLVGLSSYAQIHFEKGYFVSNNDVRTECLIKNGDWRSNPDSFEYKISEEQSAHEKGLTEVKEFGIDGAFKYEKFDGRIDVSSKNINQLTFDSQPKWEQKKVFLKVIIEGKATLYKYVNGNIERYFYSFNDSPVEQLIYKEYLQEGTNVIMKNRSFQRQLYSKVICEGVKTDWIMKLKYSEDSLSEYFIEVNNCYGSKTDKLEQSKDIVDLRQKSGKKDLYIKVKGGVNFNSLEVNKTITSSTNPNVSFDKAMAYKIGLELEYFLPFNKKKWALSFEPTYQTKYKSTATEIRNYSIQYVDNWKASYSSLDLALGLRHYMYINDNSKIFLNGSFVFGLKTGGEVINRTAYYDPASSVSLAFGLGYDYKKASIEIRYNNRNILSNYLYVTSNYQTISVVLGYPIFENKK